MAQESNGVVRPQKQPKNRGRSTRFERELAPLKELQIDYTSAFQDLISTDAPSLLEIAYRDCNDPTQTRLTRRRALHIIQPTVTIRLAKLVHPRLPALRFTNYHERLLRRSSTASDVYVTHPYQLGWTGKHFHWSLYCQGHLYHLSAPMSPANASAKASEILAGTEMKSELKHSDLSNVDTEDYQRMLNSKHPLPLLATNVGQTDLTPEEVLRIARWIIKRFSIYSLIYANCHEFAKQLLMRIVTRRSDFSGFTGTITQLADWDLRGNGEYRGSIATGFSETHDLTHPYMTWKQTGRAIAKSPSPFQVTWGHKAFTTYELGPRAYRAFTWKKLSKEDTEWFKKLHVECKKDLKSRIKDQGWKQIFKTNEELLRQKHERFQQMRDDGGFVLPWIFDRFDNIDSIEKFVFRKVLFSFFYWIPGKGN